MERAGANDGFVSAWTDLGRNKDPTSSISGKKGARLIEGRKSGAREYLG